MDVSQLNSQIDPSSFAQSRRSSATQANAHAQASRAARQGNSEQADLVPAGTGSGGRALSTSRAGVPARGSIINIVV